MRTFELSLFHGYGNILRTTATLDAESPFKAYDRFCTELATIGYPLRQEQPETIDNRLYAVWSGGCSTAGQRIWIKEQIGH